MPASKCRSSPVCLLDLTQPFCSYSLNHPQVFYTSPVFSIKPNTSQPLDSADRKTGSTSTASESTASTSTTASQTNQAANPVSGEKTIHSDAAFKHASELSIVIVGFTTIAAATLLLA
jgi:hypothetical protein